MENVNLTSNETIIFKSFLNNEGNYWGGLPSQSQLASVTIDTLDKFCAFNDAYILALDTDISEASVPGIVGSLVKKGLLEAEEHNLWLTEIGLDLAKKLLLGSE